MQKFLNNILKDIQIELDEEFDRNFERKAFFDRSWKPTKFTYSRGSLMMRSGALRKGNRSLLAGETIRFENSLPYASIHNNGGEIMVTDKMKKFCWFMYYKVSGAGSKAGGSRKLVLNQEAMMWKALALKTSGSKIKVEERKFIGTHPVVKQIVKENVDRGMEEIKLMIKNKLI